MLKTNVNPLVDCKQEMESLTQRMLAAQNLRCMSEALGAVDSEFTAHIFIIIMFQFKLRRGRTNKGPKTLGLVEFWLPECDVWLRCWTRSVEEERSVPGKWSPGSLLQSVNRLLMG